MKSKLCMVCLTCFTIWKGSIMKFENKYALVCIIWSVVFYNVIMSVNFSVREQIPYNVVVISLSMMFMGGLMGVGGSYLYLLRKGKIND